jgi:mannose-1-phosphate guanylyltransferase
MVVHADNLSQFSVPAFIAAHERRPAGAVMTMMTFDTDTPQACGIVEIDSCGIVQRFHEKVRNPPGTRANGAVYICEPEVVDFLSGLGREFIDLSTDVIPVFIGRIATYHNSGYHRDIGTVESLRRADAEFPAA